MTGQDPGWFPDPAGRAEFRYWDGELWTDGVATAGVELTDPSPVPLGPAPSGLIDAGSPTAGQAATQTRRRPPVPARIGLVLVGVAFTGLGLGAVVGAARSADVDYRAALAGDLEARSAGMLTTSEADCVATGLIEDFGEERLRELEVIGDPEGPWPLRELTDREEEAFATVSYGCVEPSHLATHLVEQWFPPTAKTTEQRTCMSQGYVEALEPERVREVLVALFTRGTFDADEVLTDGERSAVAGVGTECGL